MSAPQDPSVVPGPAILALLEECRLFAEEFPEGDVVALAQLVNRSRQEPQLRTIVRTLVQLRGQQVGQCIEL